MRNIIRNIRLRFFVQKSQHGLIRLGMRRSAGAHITEPEAREGGWRLRVAREARWRVAGGESRRGRGWRLTMRGEAS